jgi:hypothetical protein
MNEILMVVVLSHVIKRNISKHNRMHFLKIEQSKDFYAADFDALVKRWDKCINVGCGYIEK